MYFDDRKTRIGVCSLYEVTRQFAPSFGDAQYIKVLYESTLYSAWRNPATTIALHPTVTFPLTLR